MIKMTMATIAIATKNSIETLGDAATTIMIEEATTAMEAGVTTLMGSETQQAALTLMPKARFALCTELHTPMACARKSSQHANPIKRTGINGTLPLETTVALNPETIAIGAVTTTVAPTKITTTSKAHPVAATEAHATETLVQTINLITTKIASPTQPKISTRSMTKSRFMR